VILVIFVSLVAAAVGRLSQASSFNRRVNEARPGDSIPLVPRWGLVLAPWVGLVLSFAPPPDVRAAAITVTAIGRDAGLNTSIVFGGRETNTYLIETTGTGVAMFDYDADGWVDLFFVNGSTLEGFTPGAEPTNRLYRNKRNGTFEDVTVSAGLAASGWGQGACAGDVDNDGFTDLAVTYWGQNRLYRNDGRGRFADVSQKAAPGMTCTKCQICVRAPMRAPGSITALGWTW
jgi:hypothetical protein